ncbi:MAG: aldo/keto reductase [Propionibacteriales bacterium]|nr:aldo/keto reductase [Propionibacteriales bacterium]
MEHIRVGRSNLRVSRIGLGAMGIGDPSWRPWVLDEAGARPLIERALELGITFFDTCDYYSAGESERIVGRVLLEQVPREEVVIATKVGNPMGEGANSRGYSRKHILDAVDASLRRLGTDYIDIYQTHIWDTDAQIEEIVETFDDLVRGGKVRYVGATDMPAWQFAKFVYTARLTGRTSLISMQHHYNLVWRGDEREIMPMCISEGLGLFPYSPLARGFLGAAPHGLDRATSRARTDPLGRGWYGRTSDADVAQEVRRVADDRATTPAAVALAWVLARSPGAPLLGATDVGHLDVVEAALDCELTPAELERLEAPYGPRHRYGH